MFRILSFLHVFSNRVTRAEFISRQLRHLVPLTVDETLDYRDARDQKKQEYQEDQEYQVRDEDNRWRYEIGISDYMAFACAGYDTKELKLTLVMCDGCFQATNDPHTPPQLWKMTWSAGDPEGKKFTIEVGFDTQSLRSTMYEGCGVQLSKSVFWPGTFFCMSCARNIASRIIKEYGTEEFDSSTDGSKRPAKRRRLK